MWIIQLVLLGAKIFIGYLTSNYLVLIDYNKDKNIHRFVLSDEEGNFWRMRDRETAREMESVRERKRNKERQKAWQTKKASP